VIEVNVGYFVEIIIRPGKAIVKAFRASFHRFDHRCRPVPVGSRLMSAMYTHLRAAVSVGKCPRALTALRIRAFTDSKVILRPGTNQGRDLRVCVVEEYMTRLLIVV
jgi:hypothetical protein